MSLEIHSEDIMHSDGTTALETISLIIPSIFGVYVTTTLGNLIPNNKKWQFLLEFSTLCAPMIFFMTLLSKYINTIIILIFILNLSLCCLVYNCFYNIKHEVTEYSERRIPLLINARATINILTVIAILAVDFQIFPRKYAKTSTFGFSLMDLGAGLYIYANSLVSPASLNKKDSNLGLIKSCIPLLILGISRLVLTRQVDYHVPVAEYGIHWNFFFTLLFTKCIGSLIIKLANVEYMEFFSILIFCVHEILLQNFFLDIVLYNEFRNTFFLANKEGISSILGYVGLYLFSVYFGHILKKKVYGSLKVKENLKFFFKYLIITGVATLVLNAKFGTSRRLANASYCVWIIFIGILAAFLFYLGELLQNYSFGKKSNYIRAPYIYRAIDFNVLFFFLLGNIFTGIVNVYCDTLNVNNETALIILLLYTFILTVIMCFLYERKVKLKIS